MRIKVALAAAVLMLGACTAGRDFPKPTPDQVVLGQTMRSEILAKYGPPRSQKENILSSAATPAGVRTPFDADVVAGRYNLIVYAFADALAGRTEGGSVPARSVAFQFLDDRLIAYQFVSTFGEDSTNFDETKISALEKGKTTKNDIVALLGEPGGHSIYPAIQRQGDEKLSYSFVSTDVQTRQRATKRLELLIDGSSRLLEYRYLSDSAPVPVPAQTTTTVVPIIIPRGK